MRYSLKKKISIVAVAAMMLLTSGCGVLMHPSRSVLNVEGAVKPQEIESEKAIDYRGDDEDKLVTDIKKNIEIDPANYKRVLIKSYLGETYVRPSSSGRLEVQFYLLHSGKMNEKQKEYWEKTSLNIIEKNGVVYIEPFFPNDIYKNFEIFYNDSFGDERKVIIDIGVPENIKELGLSNNVGYVELSDISANIRLSNNVGEIDINNITPIDALYISNNVGEIDCSIKDLSKVHELINLTNVGEMSFDIKDQMTQYDQIMSSTFGDDKSSSDGSKGHNKEDLYQIIDQMEETMDKSIDSDDAGLFEDWEAIEPKERPLFVNVSNVGEINVRRSN